MSVQSLDRHIEADPDIAGGRPRIAGHRITVQDIAIWHERMGRSVDEIASEHELSLAELHAALAYYFDHREDIDRRIAEDEAFISALRSSTPSALARKLGAEGGG